MVQAGSRLPCNKLWGMYSSSSTVFPCNASMSSNHNLSLLHLIIHASPLNPVVYSTSNTIAFRSDANIVCVDTLTSPSPDSPVIQHHHQWPSVLQRIPLLLTAKKMSNPFLLYASKSGVTSFVVPSLSYTISMHRYPSKNVVLNATVHKTYGRFA